MRTGLHAAIAISTLAAALASPARAETKDTYEGAAVTVVKAAKTCFSDTIAVSGLVVPREEIPVRPEREGFLVSAVLVEAGDTVTKGQVMARLTPPGAPSGTAATALPAPIGGTVLKANAKIGALASASPKAPALFQIIAGGEFELAAEMPTKHLGRLSPGQTAKVQVVGIGEVPGQVRTIATAIDAKSQLAQVRLFLGTNQALRVGGFGRAIIVTGESCGVAVPLSAVLYGGEGAVVAVVQGDRVVTRRVTVGLFSEGEAEIREGLQEGELVVARAGAFVREGDLVRPVLSEPAK
jgi:HlyD family secretion protein